jgi:hypothetical protein
MTGTPLKLTKEQVHDLMLKVAHRYRGESPEFRYGFICALDLIGHDGDESAGGDYDGEKALRDFYKLIGKGWKKVWKG